jgi:putative methyltransferase (TIGR04325 family)
MGTLLAMHESALSRISILDFGGAAGIHYFHSLSTIRSSISRYVICESPAVSKNLSEISSPILFVSTLDHFRRDEFEVGIASGSLQCVKDPYESLEKLIHATQYLVLDRMPIVSEITQDEILVQKSFSKSGRRISYPVWFLSEEKFKQKISDFGGEILCSWEVPEDRPYFRKKRRPYFGYLVKCSN